MENKEYTEILNHAEKENVEYIKGIIICKAKDCINILYKNYSTSKPEYCEECCQIKFLVQLVFYLNQLNLGQDYQQVFTPPTTDP